VIVDDLASHDVATASSAAAGAQRLAGQLSQERTPWSPTGRPSAMCSGARSLSEPPQLMSIVTRDHSVRDNAKALGYSVE
jgi:hypothetical protein